MGDLWTKKKSGSTKASDKQKAHSMDHIFTVTPPGPFNFEPRSWPAWITWFERFRVASGLKEKDGAYQVNSLIYKMGDKADDILSSLQLTEEKQKENDEVKHAFD